MKILKDKIKYVVLAVISAFLLVFVGILTLNDQIGADSKGALFKLTTFDYLINDMSESQVDEYLSNTTAVDGAFPVSAFQTSVKGKNSATITIMLSDRLESYKYGIMTDATCIKGSFDKNGIMIDENTANMLGVGVGDTLSYSILGRQYKKTVSGVYLKSNYKNLNSGIAIASADGILSKASMKYSFVFLDAKNTALCDEMLASYVPLRTLKSMDEYIESKGIERFSGESDTRYQERCQGYYDEYVESFYKQTFTNKVQMKADLLESINEENISVNESIKNVSYTVAIIAPVALFIFFVIFTMEDSKVILLKSRYGSRKKNVFLSLLLPPALASLFVLASVVLLLGGFSIIRLSVGKMMNSMFIGSYLSIVGLFSLPSVLLFLGASATAFFIARSCFKKLETAKGTKKKRSKEKAGGFSQINLFVLSRKYISLIAFVGLSLISMIILFIVGLSSAIEGGNEISRYKKYKDDSICYLIQPVEKDTFINYNSYFKVLGHDSERLNVDVLSDVSGMKYTDNLLGFDGGLGKEECAVTKNVLKEYNLKVRDTLYVTGVDSKLQVKTFSYTITKVLDPGKGLDTLYEHMGSVVLGKNTELDALYETQESTTYFLASVDRASGSIMSFDMQRKQQMVSAADMKKKASGDVAKGIIIFVLGNAILAAVFEIFVVRKRYRVIKTKRIYGISKMKTLKLVFAECSIKYLVPSIITILGMLILYGYFGSSYILFSLLSMVILWVMAYIYSYIRYLEVIK